MIITLKGANFSASNIGTLSTWNIQYSLGTGASTTSATSVDRDGTYSGIITIANDYELGTAGVSITMGGSPVTSGVAVNGNTITISITKVTGNIVIKVPTKKIGSDEEDNGGSGGETPPSGGDNLLTLGTLLSGKTLKKDDYILASSSGYFTYDKIPVQPNTTYIAQNGRRMWELDSAYNAVQTQLLTENTPQYVFTTSDTTAYVSIAFNTADGVSSDTAVMSVYTGTIPDPDPNNLLTFGTLHNPGALKKDSYLIDNTNASYFTYDQVPVLPNTTYIVPQSRRLWELDSNLQGISTKLLNDEDPAYVFTTSGTTAYISVSFTTSDGAKPDTVTMTVYNG